MGSAWYQSVRTSKLHLWPVVTTSIGEKQWLDERKLHRNATILAASLCFNTNPIIGLFLAEMRKWLKSDSIIVSNNPSSITGRAASVWFTGVVHYYRSDADMRRECAQVNILRARIHLANTLQVNVWWTLVTSNARMNINFGLPRVVASDWSWART